MSSPSIKTTAIPAARPTLLADFHSPSTLLIGWPLRSDTWRAQAAPAQVAVVRFIGAILRHTRSTPICIVVDDREGGVKCVQKRLCAEFGGIPERVSLMQMEMDDCWLRDTGPMVMSGGVGACFRFNGWGGEDGGCYVDFGRDQGVKRRLCGHFGMTMVEYLGVVVEGGAVVGDGEGTVITTRECVLNGNRNGGMGESVIDEKLKKVLGVEVVIWLEWGAAWDWDVDGHVDNMVRFVGRGHVVLLWAEEGEQGRRSRAALKVLERAVDARGRKLRVSKVWGCGKGVVRTREEAMGVEKQVGVKERKEGERVCASGLNFVAVEDAVFVPTFQDARSRAEADLAEVWSKYERKVVGVEAREFALAGGGLHCLTLGVE